MMWFKKKEEKSKKKEKKKKIDGQANTKYRTQGTFGIFVSEWEILMSYKWRNVSMVHTFFFMIFG